MAAATPRRTKIVATIGPASASPEMLRELIASGMNAARLNLSHGTHDDHAARAELIREAQDESGRPIAIIGDLQGPKIRVGDLDSPMTLERGSEVVVRELVVPAIRDAFDGTASCRSRHRWSVTSSIPATRS